MKEQVGAPELSGGNAGTGDACDSIKVCRQ